MIRPLLLLFSVITTQIYANTLHYTGYAYEDELGSLVYTEHYKEIYSNGQQLVRSKVKYYSQSGDILANKQLNYAEHPYAPEFQFHNLKTGYKESLTWIQPGQALLAFTNSDGKTRQKKLELDPNSANVYVADAGFDHFLRSHLSQIKTGTTLKFRFLNPARLNWYTFEARLISQDHHLLKVMVQPKSAILRWLVEPIELTYNLGQQNHPSGRLIRYEGLTNISLNDQQQVKAKILYKYEQNNAKPFARSF